MRGVENTVNTHKLVLGTTHGYNTPVDALTISNGNVGIGTSTPAANLDVTGAGGGTIRISGSGQGSNEFSKLEFYNYDGSLDGPQVAGKISMTGNSSGVNSDLNFYTAASNTGVEGADPSLRMRIDNVGRVLVGTTVAPPFGNVNFGGHIYATSALGDENSGIYMGLNGVYPSVNGVLSDNQIDLGNSVYRWDDVYATNGAINTSDRNEKQDILAITTAEANVATACKGLLRSFRWKDSVAEKGDDARIHFGIIAQDLQGAFTAEGLDAGRYAIYLKYMVGNSDRSSSSVGSG
tara:strand:- start:86 stop:964 length:879 start_codon:yes stop_codon:yes gene_type:complete